MLCDWHVQVCMLDYDVDPEKGKKFWLSFVTNWRRTLESGTLRLHLRIAESSRTSLRQRFRATLKGIGMSSLTRNIHSS